MQSIRTYESFECYELTDHLGNVRVVISDRRFLTDENNDDSYDSNDLLHAEVISANDYYPFGMPSKIYNPQEYRFGFNGQEKDNEWTGTEGSHLVFKYRIHDARIGRFLSIDPLTAKYPHNSPYAFSENSTIAFVELEGLEKITFMKAGKDMQGNYFVEPQTYDFSGMTDKGEINKVLKRYKKFHRGNISAKEISKQSNDHHHWIILEIPSESGNSLGTYVTKEHDGTRETERRTDFGQKVERFDEYGVEPMTYSIVRILPITAALEGFKIWVSGKNYEKEEQKGFVNRVLKPTVQVSSLFTAPINSIYLTIWDVLNAVVVSTKEAVEGVKEYNENKEEKK